MILWLVAAALAAAIAALAWNARRYARWANAKWPPQGRFVEIPGNHMSAVMRPELGDAIAEFLAA